MPMPKFQSLLGRLKTLLT